MKDDRRNYIAVGIFVIAMAAALVAWLAILSGRTGATDPYYILYDNVMGVKTGTQILFEGYPVGLIERIGRAEDAGRQRFRVDVSIRRGWRIPEDSVARITAPALLSAPAIDIQSGASPLAVEPGGAIPGQEASNVLDVVSDVGSGVDRLLEGTIEPWLGELTADTLRITANVEGFTADLSESLARIDALLKPQNAERVERILDHLEELARNAADLSAGLGETRETLDRLVSRVDALVAGNEARVGHAVADAHESLEAVARHVDAISDNLEATARNMNEFSRQIRADPSLLLRGREAGDEPAEGRP